MKTLCCVLLLSILPVVAPAQGSVEERISTLDKELSDILSAAPTDRQMTSADWQSVAGHYRAEIRRVKAEARASHFPDFRGAVQEVRKKMLIIQRIAAPEPPPDSPLRRESDNDDCADATRIGDGDFTGYSWDASRDGFSSCVGGSLVDVWYRYTAPSSGRRVVMLSTKSYYSDSALSVHQGGPCGDKTNEIACAFDCGLSIDDTSV